MLCCITLEQARRAACSGATLWGRNVMTPEQRERIEGAINRDEQVLTRWLAKKLGDVEAARDVAQSVFLRVWSYAEKVEIENPRGLIFKTAANLALNEMKRRSRHTQRHVEPGAKPYDDPALQVASSAPSPEAQTSLREDLALIMEAIARLPEKPKRAFTMSRFDGLSYREIAKILNVSESSVEKYMIDALKQLRKVLHENESSKGRGGE